ncbi:hypothetical protein Bca4012_082248 [Brassica carinata]
MAATARNDDSRSSGQAALEERWQVDVRLKAGDSGDGVAVFTHKLVLTQFYIRQHENKTNKALKGRSLVLHIPRFLHTTEPYTSTLNTPSHKHTSHMAGKYHTENWASLNLTRAASLCGARPWARPLHVTSCGGSVTPPLENWASPNLTPGSTHITGELIFFQSNPAMVTHFSLDASQLKPA